MIGRRMKHILLFVINKSIYKEIKEEIICLLFSWRIN